MLISTSRAAVTLGGISALLGVVWLIRGPLGIQQYSVTILLVGFGLFFLGRVLRTETNSGAGRALASLLWNLLAAFVGIILSIWILGWVAALQSDVFPSMISRWVPDLVIGGIAAGLGAGAVKKTGLARGRTTPSLDTEDTGPTREGTRLIVQPDMGAMRRRRLGRT